MYKRPQTRSAAAPDQPASAFVAVPADVLQRLNEEGGKRRWLSFSNLKIEAAVFLLIALTFAAVLSEGAITHQSFQLDGKSRALYPYSYGDDNMGGKSTISFDPARPMAFSCNLAADYAYRYCGYGVSLEAPNSGKGVNFSKYKTIVLHLTYHGTGDHMKLMMKNRLPEPLHSRIKDGSDMPLVAEFDVHQGDNLIRLNMDAFTVEQWWVSANQLTEEEGKPAFGNITAVAFGSGNGAQPGRFDVAVTGAEFEGRSLSTAQWYLVILGAWLVLTGAFLVYRFLSLRRGYEERQRRQAEESEALARARAAAESASAAKTRFLANMSHELRTPLNAILGYTQYLTSTGLTQAQIEAVRTIHQSGDHLLTLITDILDIAKVEAGKLEFLSGPFDLHDALHGVGQMVRLRAREKGLSFAVEIGEGVPRYVVADAKRVRQVLINLLVNAVKFTASGGVRLGVSVVSGGEDTVGLRFDVSDTGIGVAPDQVERIFRPFEQAGNAIDRSGGTGLGLSITAQIVAVMHGDIRVESTPGEGSCFIVELPFTLAAASGEPEALPASEPVLEAETDGAAMKAPAGEIMERLAELARAGNLRAIRKEIPAIRDLGPQYAAFADRLDSLAAAYQSPAVLRLIETCDREGEAA